VTSVAIVGAGPYGLSIAAQLRARGISYRIFGTPVDTWRRHIPAGMTLKSDGFASNLCGPDGQGTLAEYCAQREIPYHDTKIPVSLAVFIDYALDFQQRFVPDVEDRQVVAVAKTPDGFTLTLDGGETVIADLVVGAVGITHFGQIPDELAHLPAELVSHSSAHSDMTALAGRDVTVIGGGSSAVDLSTLLAEGGANVSLVARRTALRFSSPPGAGERSLWQRLRHPSSGLGPGMRSYLYQKVPHLFRFLPGNVRLGIIKRHLGPQSAWLMRERFDNGVSATLGAHLEKASEEGGRVRLAYRTADGVVHDMLTDHVICATGYRADVERLMFLSAGLRSSIRTHTGQPVLSGTFESSVPGLYFVGPPAVNSFGPLMRFMVGSEYVAPRIARRLAAEVARKGTVRGADRSLASA
jgi:cation diffusion facilitator CzcD-associated flavoprotein CzcO